MTIILFLLVLTFLVFVHELGHFLFAKKFGIRVDEFAIGFPPKIFSWKRGETVYSINLIPFGGFVRIFGENPNDESLNGPDSSRSFVNKNRWKQGAVLVAGVLFNFIFAWILYSGSYMVGVPGSDSTNPEKVIVTEVMEKSPAKEAGLEVGDSILNVSKTNNNETPKKISSEIVRNTVENSEGLPITISLIRSGENKNIVITPKKGVVSENFAIGIGMADVSTKKLPFFNALGEGFKQTVYITKETTKGILSFLGDAILFRADLSSVAGPVGIAGVVGQAKDFGLGYLFSITALISINLAVLNLIPFPALDGGRLLFVGIEGIIRRRISPKFLNAVNAIGFIFLITLMLVVSWSDIARLLK